MCLESVAVRFPKVAHSLVRLADSCSRPKSWSCRLREGSHRPVMAAIATLWARSRSRDWAVVRPSARLGRPAPSGPGPQPSSRPPGWPGPPPGPASFSGPKSYLWPFSPFPQLVTATVSHLGPGLRVCDVLFSPNRPTGPIWSSSRDVCPCVCLSPFHAIFFKVLKSKWFRCWMWLLTDPV